VRHKLFQRHPFEEGHDDEVVVSFAEGGDELREEWVVEGGEQARLSCQPPARLLSICG
jgi:hypothetical protein